MNIIIMWLCFECAANKKDKEFSENENPQHSTDEALCPIFNNTVWDVGQVDTQNGSGRLTG